MNYIVFYFLLEKSQSTKMGSFYKWFYTHFLLLPQLSEFLKIKQLAKAEGRIQKTVSDHQLFYLFLNFYLSWCLRWLMANKLSSLSASLSLWRHSEIYSRICSLSNKCLFIFMNVTLSAFQLENQAYLSFANCKVLSYTQGLICRPKHLY